jgi:C4-type Zn-finger protein
MMNLNLRVRTKEQRAEEEERKVTCPVCEARMLPEMVTKHARARKDVKHQVYVRRQR